MANLINVPGDFPTISAAIAAAQQYDTIRVAPGLYNETVVVNKTIQLLGAQAGVDARTRSGVPGTESIITSVDGNGIVQVTAENAVVDGFTVQNNSAGNGIFTSPSASGYWIFNNIVRNNGFGIYLHSNGTTFTQARQNYLIENNQAAGASGNGIYSDAGALNVYIDSNRFTGHQPAASINFASTTSPQQNIIISNNEMVADNSIALTNTDNVKITGNHMVNTQGSSVFFGGGTDRTEIEENRFENSISNGINVTDAFNPGVPNTNIRIKNNIVQGNANAGLNVQAGAYNIAPRALDATNNWWGSPTGPSGAGPGNGDAIIDPDGVVIFEPFLTSEPPTPTPDFTFNFINPVINHSFETGSLAPWTGINASINSSFTKTGSRSAQLAGGNVNAFIQQFVPVEPNENHELLVSLARLGGGTSPTVVVYVQYYTSAFSFISLGLTITIPANNLPNAANGEWKTIYGTTLNAPSNAANALILINKLPLTGSSSVLADDVSLLKIAGELV